MRLSKNELSNSLALLETKQKLAPLGQVLKLWLTIVNEFRTTYYNDIMNIATHLESIKNLFNQLDLKRNSQENHHFVYKNNKQNSSLKPLLLLR